jgi:hypothetical protein
VDEVGELVITKWMPSIACSRPPRPLSGADLDPGLDPERGEECPCGVLTGDTLFIGDVGRPDLRASLGWSAER